ncbi:MAG: hypothetical protein Q9173_003050 [Seirophora scorigena]
MYDIQDARSTLQKALLESLSPDSVKGIVKPSILTRTSGLLAVAEKDPLSMDTELLPPPVGYGKRLLPRLVDDVARDDPNSTFAMLPRWIPQSRLDTALPFFIDFLPQFTVVHGGSSQPSAGALTSELSVSP